MESKNISFNTDNLLYLLDQFSDSSTDSSTDSSINSSTDNVISNSDNNNELSEYKCNSCDSINKLVYENGMIICSNCHEITDYYIDNKNECNNYENDSGPDMNRCGAPVNDLIEDFGTNIAKQYSSAGLQRIYQAHIYIRNNYKTTSLQDIFNRIESCCNDLNINQAIFTDAKYLYKEINNIQIFRGVNRKACIAACIYIACEIAKFRIESDLMIELSNYFSINVSFIRNAKKNILDVLNINKKNIINNNNIVQAETYIPLYIHKLNIPQYYIKLINILLKKCKELPINKNTPPAVACSIIYLVSIECELNISIIDISKVSNISKNTIDKCYNKLIEWKDMLFSKNLKDKLKLIKEKNIIN